MDPLLLCGAPCLSLCGAPTVSPCGEPQPISADAPSLLCGAPSIMLCGELQPVSADMLILIRGAQVLCAKGCSTLALMCITVSCIALPGSASASTGCGACSFSSLTRLMAEAALWWVGMLGKGGCATVCLYIHPLKGIWSVYNSW